MMFYKFEILRSFGLMGRRKFVLEVQLPFDFSADPVWRRMHGIWATNAETASGAFLLIGFLNSILF